MLQALRPRLAEIWPAASRPLEIVDPPLASEAAKSRGQHSVATDCCFSELLSRVCTGLKALAHRTHNTNPSRSTGEEKAAAISW